MSKRNMNSRDGACEEDADFPDEFESDSLTDALDHEIVMHRESHFGGLFSVMIEYYEADGKGAQPDFSLERIRFLAREEELLMQNFAPLLLSGSECERIADAKSAYKKLRDVYEIPEEESFTTRLIADLILSEDEIPVNEIDNIVAAGVQMVPSLVELLQSKEFADPLFPGYGLAPEAAARCLGLIKDASAVIPLFELFGKESFFMDEAILSAFKDIGEESMFFLIKVLQSRPVTRDNERAAMALSVFSENPLVAEAALAQLHKHEMIKNPLLATYLVLLCESLNQDVEKQEFLELFQSNSIALSVRNEMELIIQTWKKRS